MSSPKETEPQREDNRHGPVGHAVKAGPGPDGNQVKNCPTKPDDTAERLKRPAAVRSGTDEMEQEAAREGADRRLVVKDEGK